jgi:hypothetical protein
MKPVSPLYKTALVLSWIIAGIIALLPLHAVLTTWLGSNFGHLDLFRVWKELILILITPFAAWLAWKNPKIRDWLLNSWVTRLFAIYIILHIALGAWAYANHQVNGTALIYALIINMRFIGFFIICYIVAASCKFLKENWRVILLAPAAFVMIFGLIQRFLLPYDFLRHLGYGPGTIPAYQTVDSNIDYRRIQSTLRGANPLGAYLVLVIPAIILAIKSTWLKIAGLAASLLVLFYTYSRSGWIGVLLALITLIWINKIHVGRLRWLAAAGIGALLIGYGVFLVSNTNQTAQDALFHTSSNSKSSVTSNEKRASALKDGINDVINRPLGNGPGTAGPASFRNSNHTSRVSENYYLQIGQEVGLAGMLIFITINVLVGLELWVRKNQPLAQILLVSLVGITFVNLLSHAWTDDTLSLLWWGFAGICIAPDILTGRQKAHGKNYKKKS